MKRESYPMYKGLQMPLMYRGLKGKYIYIAGGVAVGSLITSLILAGTVGSVAGLVALAVGLGGGLVGVASMQKKGLHNKRKDKGIYIISKGIEL